MRRQVEVLPQTLINKIAAGEVIVRPASVVKEAVENSFDAGARHIRVEVSRDTRSITVSDDGCGMDPENAKRSVLRHSTSKIREFNDLTALSTRGFRGEGARSHLLDDLEVHHVGQMPHALHVVAVKDHAVQ